jgi:hypothetical protein
MNKQDLPIGNADFQLKVLADMSAIFQKQNMEFWLRGGWAIDFLLGKITRQHDDIDVVTWVENRIKLEEVLIQAGFEEVSVREPFRGRQADFRKGQVDITFSYITLSEEGSLMLNGLPEWVWHSDSLLDRQFSLHGIRARALHPKQLLEEKKVYEQIGRARRAKDKESKEILRGILLDWADDCKDI